jgi:hypothetical protein
MSALSDYAAPHRLTNSANEQTLPAFSKGGTDRGGDKTEGSKEDDTSTTEVVVTVKASEVSTGLLASFGVLTEGPKANIQGEQTRSTGQR